MEKTVYDVIILGSGPSGLTAAIYTTRANLKTLVVAGENWGGQLMLTTLVENFPGFPEGIQGPDLMLSMRKQAERHGATIVNYIVQRVDFSKQPFSVTSNGVTYQGKTIIIATGADTRWLGVSGEKEKIGRGVSSCAPCDAPFFRNKQVIVVGGGDSAMEEALVLARFASHVTIVHRRDSFKASSIMLKRAQDHERITFILNTEIAAILGDQHVSGVRLRDVKTKEEKEMAIDGVFVAIGHMPNTQVLQGIDLDEEGYVKVFKNMQTNINGVFVSGDIHDHTYRQAVTAAGFGCQAALEAERFLEK